MEKSEPCHQISNSAFESRKRRYSVDSPIGVLPKIQRRDSPTLENLPSAILDLIFMYIQSPDLLKLMSLSKPLYWDVASRVYRSITITDLSEFQKARKYVVTWRINSGTLLPRTRLKSLVRTLQTNKQLGELVRTVSLYKLSIIKEKLIVDFLWSVPNLTAFHNVSNFVIPQQIVKKLSTLTCFIEHALVPMGNVRELRIIDLKNRYFKPYYAQRFTANDDNQEEKYHMSSDGDSSESDDDYSMHPCASELYRELARDLVKSEGHVGLRKLHFSPGEEDIAEQFSVSEYTESWISFFDELNLMKVKLDLDSLAIPGVENGKAPGAVKKLQDSVNLRNLKQLVVVDKYANASPKALCLALLTSHTPNLKSLAYFLFCEEFDEFSVVDSHVDSLSEVIQVIIPDQLEELAVVIDNNDASDGDHMRDAIFSRQKNLVRLKIDDGSSMYEEEEYPGASFLLFDCARLSRRGESKRQLMFPRVISEIHSRPTLNKILVREIKQTLQGLNGQIRTDSIYEFAPRYFPRLNQYYLGGAYVDPKSRGIYINDRVALLGSREAGDVNGQKDEVADHGSVFTDQKG